MELILIHINSRKGQKANNETNNNHNRSRGAGWETSVIRSV